MVRLYDLIAHQHDPWMVALAVLVCALGSYATFVLGIYAVLSRDPARRRRWGVVTLIINAAVLWSTHFIALLAYRPHVQTGFLIAPTLLSAVVAMTMIGCGGWVAIHGRSRRASTIAGAVSGLAIALVHAVGLFAFRTNGTLVWDPRLLVVAVAIGLAFSMLSGFSSWGWRAPRVWTPALFLVVAVCGEHFVAMAALSIASDPTDVLPVGLMEGRELSPIVASIAAFAVCLTLGAHRLHLKATRRMSAERRRFQEFADFAVEGLIICDGGRIVWANRSIEGMTGQPQSAFTGATLSALFPRSAIDRFSPDREVETVIGRDDALTPVRVITKAIVLEDRPHVVVAVRDQRERLRAEAEMRRLADSDPLTGLANRARFNAALEQVLGSRRVDGRHVALLSLDLDRFKQVNDAHGHAAGDALLVRVAGRLNAIVRDGTVVARIGGDEFSIVASDLVGVDGIRALADRIVDVLSRPFVIDGLVHEIGASVGVALAPSDGDTATVLIRNADLALYRAKDDGRGVYRLFEAGMDARMQARRGLELALRRALARHEFVLHYQPQVDATTGAVIGAEALIRWHDPERGLVPPVEFIPIAEETNLIAGIGEWVLHTACAEAARWPAHLYVAVNLSPVQFRDPRLFSIVESALQESGLPGDRLELEITETALIEDEGAVRKLLLDFKALGVRISLDDFGTGYSSLGHLRRLPLDKIKIDRSFTSRLPDDRDSAAIVRAVVSLGQNLGITTTAEGVETEAQRAFVANEGCDQIQGYFFSRPLAADALPASFRMSARPDPCPSSDFSIAATAR